MNWIAGIYNLDGQAVDPTLLNKMMEPARTKNAGTFRSWIDGAIGMASYGPTPTQNKFAKAEPPTNENCRLRICFDGRIDNPGELLDLTGLHPRNGHEPSDLELVTAAYRTWGTACWGKIIGDFALSLWDEERQSLVCARDVFGVRTLFYCLCGKSLIWASRISQLLGLGQISRTLEKEYFANYLVRLSLPLALTPYKNIKRLEPAHSLTVENARVSTNRYWKPDPSKEISYSSSDQYAAHFRQLLREAVQARLRANGPVWCELSGGLDSSSIACMAQELVRERATPPEQLNTLSWVYDKAYYSDERRWIEPVVKKHNLAHRYISCDHYYPLQDFARSSVQWDEPSYQNIFDSLFTKISQELRKGGIAVVLSGQAGDQTVVPGYCPVYIADLFRKCRFGQVAQELLQWQRDLRLPLTTVFINACARPLFRRNLIYFEGELESFQNPVPTWINRSFAKEMDLRHRALYRLVAPPYDSRAYQARCERVMEVPETLYRGERETVCEHRYPYLDKRLVEFCLGVPWNRLYPPGEPKSLIRRGLSDLLPEEVRTRMGTKGPAHAFFLGLNKEWARLEPMLRNPRLGRLGCIEPDAFRHALKLARAGYAVSTPELLITLSLENWLINNEP